MTCLRDVTYKRQKSPNSKPLVVHDEHLKPFHADRQPLTWGEAMEIFCVQNDNRQSNDQSDRQLNDQSGVDQGNMIDDDAENLLHKAEQCDDTNQILWWPVHQRMPPAHLAEYHLDWQLYIGHALLGSNPFLFGLSAVLNEDWTCRVCGITLKSHSQLYRHSLSVQNPRLCLYCDHVENRLHRMQLHIAHRHHIVCVAADETELLYHVENALCMLYLSHPHPQVEEKHVTEIKDAVYHLIATVGYQNLLSEVCDTSSDPLQTINMVTSCIK